MAYVITMTKEQMEVCLEHLGDALQKLNASEPEPKDTLMNAWHWEACSAVRSMMQETRDRLEREYPKTE